jgi:hypothetical protein
MYSEEDCPGVAIAEAWGDAFDFAARSAPEAVVSFGNETTGGAAAGGVEEKKPII